MSDNASQPNEKKHFEPIVELTPSEKPEAPVAVIKVIGVGGGGGNAVSNMYRENVEGVRFLVCNTDAKALAASLVPEHVQLGPGLGAGGRPERGRELAEENVEAIREALEDGNIDPKTVVHINAHATSTPAGDLPEATAMHETFGEHTKNIAVSATKSMTGHLLGGAGALEAVLTVLALHHRTAPCTINLDNKDPQIDLDVVTEARELPAGEIVALSNSFGFGGHNAVVAFRSVED